MNREEHQREEIDKMVHDLSSVRPMESDRPMDRILQEIEADMAADANKFLAFRDLLKKLFMASLEMVESEPNMPPNAETETTFESVMGEVQQTLSKVGINVPELPKS